LEGAFQTSVLKHPFQKTRFKKFLAVSSVEPGGYDGEESIYVSKAAIDSAQLSRTFGD